MSNHFHLLCEVPPAQELSEAQLLERIQAGYGPARRQALDQELARLRQQPDGAEQIQRRLQPYRRRMFDLSSFIKELKGRFAQWYNRRRGRARIPSIEFRPKEFCRSFSLPVCYGRESFKPCRVNDSHVSEFAKYPHGSRAAKE
jgi:hypothetical protein